MAIKPFEIQSPSLVLAGVQMQAGTTGVVIPGVTQATSYSVEDVEDTGDQTDTWGSVPTVIDNGRYTILNGGSEPAGYTISEYVVEELDGDGYIDDIEVTEVGAFPASYESTVTQNMWATTVADPFTSFNPADWTQIPFAPQVRAGDVENVGGSATVLGFGYTIGDATNPGEISFNNPAESESNPAHVTSIVVSSENSNGIDIDNLVSYLDDKKVIATASNNSGKQASYDVSSITTVTVSYNGYKGVYSNLWDNDPGFSKIAFYKDTATATVNVPSDTNNDLFEVNLSDISDMLGLVVLFTENAEFTPTKANLDEYFKYVVDNILDPAGGNISDIRSLFYDEIANTTDLISGWGENPYNLQFYTNNVNSVYTGATPSTTSGAGAEFSANIAIAGDGTYRITSFNGGVGFAVNDTITYDGSYFNGIPVDNDLILTVTAVDGDGVVTTFDVAGTNPAVWPTNYIDDGGDDQYDVGNYLSTNYQSPVPYSDGLVQSTGAFNNNDWFVGYAYGQFIFFGNNTDGPVNYFGTYGETGSDGSGQRKTGQLLDVIFYDFELSGILDYSPELSFDSGSVTLSFDIAGPDTNGVVFSQTEINTITTFSGDLSLQAADDVDIYATDDVRITGGTKLVGQNNQGGDVYVNGGEGSESQIASGSNAGDGGDISITAGPAGGNNGDTGYGAEGGSVTIAGGQSTANTNGGTVTIRGGYGSGAGVKGNVIIDQDGGTWIFDAYGNTIFPRLDTPRGDTAGGTLTGPTMRMGTPDYQELVITTPDGDTNVNASQRLVINPGKGADGTSGEGGDIYLWAGRGGSGDTGNAISAGSGGDIKIRGSY
jgi:hypothetical protein